MKSDTDLETHFHIVHSISDSSQALYFQATETEANPGRKEPEQLTESRET